MQKRRDKKVEEVDIEPIDQRFTVNRARMLFLNAIKESAPDVLKTLSHISKSEFLYDLALKRALEKWANKWNINTEWVLSIAYETLLSFKEFPHYRALFWQPVSVGWDIIDIPEVVKTPKGFEVWQADVEPRKFYLERGESLINIEINSSIFSDLTRPLKVKIKQAKKEQIHEYCYEVVKVCIDLKDKDGNPLWKKVERKANLDRNARWAVRYQILGQSFYAIAKQGTDTRQDAKGRKLHHSTVLKEVKDFLELIGLDERERQRGRPKGQKDSADSHRQTYKNLDLLN